MMGDFQKIVVAIPTLNEERIIGQVLLGLILQQRELPDLQIVVADGGSTDETISVVSHMAVEFPFIHLINNEKVLQSAGINKAARYDVSADVLVRCDAHAVYPRDFIKRLLITLDESGADSVVVPMDSIGSKGFQKAVGWVSDTLVGSGGSAHRAGKVSGFVDHGHHAAFRLQSFLATGGYSEDFSHNEDAEFDCRFNALGRRIYLDSNIRIGYLPRSDIVSLWRQYFNYGKGRSRTIRRHPGTMRFRQFAVPVHTVVMLVSLIAFCLTGSILLAAWPIIYLTALMYTSVMVALKHHSLYGLMAGPAAFAMHTAWGSGFLWGVLTIREHRWDPSTVNETRAEASVEHVAEWLELEPRVNSDDSIRAGLEDSRGTQDRTV